MDTAMNFLKELWGIVGEMSPYLLFGFLVAGLLSVLISPATVEKHVGNGGALSVFKASLFGVPLPLCSCGVIPVGMSLRRHGAGRAATTAFLISTPQTGVDSIMVTYSLLGPLFAVVRPFVALVTGFAGGLIVNAVDKSENKTLPMETTCAANGNCSGGTCAPASSNANARSENRLIAAGRYGFVTLPHDIGRFLFFGLILAAVISAVIPENYFSSYLGRGILPMLAMLAVGIPMYVCSTASVPVAAALMAGGVSPGAALVFLMTGPATNAATITTIWKVLGRSTALIYLGTIAVGSMLFGLGMDAIWSGAGAHFHHAPHDMLPLWIKNVSAVILLLVIAPSLWKGKMKIAEEPSTPAGTDQPDVRTLVLQIQGMRCSRCVESITNNVAEQKGVNSVNVDLEAGRGVITGSNFDAEALIRTIHDLGYTATEEEPAGSVNKQ